MHKLLFLVMCVCSLFHATQSTAIIPHVAVTSDHLLIDGQVSPYWFGAEVQYFRARGGPGRNIPSATVETLWDRMIDRVIEAHMNAVSIYVPWDFHEPVEGVYDFFDGKLDLDHDGQPDYPSRNLRAFLHKLVSRGIQQIMIRPGPYINAEWGPTGFGAVPLWFLEKYPEALTTSQKPDKPRTASFGHPIFRKHIERWFRTLYGKVLSEFVGPNKPVLFVQIDNETNYFWDSAYERDRSPFAHKRYRRFLRSRYHNSVSELNLAYHAGISNFEAIQPPSGTNDRRYPGKAWHYDWYLFHDVEIHDYYRFLRTTWERVGLREPDILFTSCDSFNAFDHGLLPRLDYRQGNRLTLSTMNIYPKTTGTQAQSTLNEPMKGAHDAALFRASHRQFYGSAANWLMTTETVGGWFPKWAEVSLATLQHTYGCTLGSGVKAMTIYYFHEGWNWDGKEKSDSELLFNAPLDKDMEARPSFRLIKAWGKALKEGLGNLANYSRPLTSPVLIAHDAKAQYPLPGLPDALKVASHDSASLFGLFREAGFLPDVGYLGAMSDSELLKYQAVIWKSPGYASGSFKHKLQHYLSSGGTVIVVGKNPLMIRSRKLIQLTEDPAEGWNSDGYVHIRDAQARLNLIRRLMGDIGVVPLLLFEATDREPFIHAWLSSGRSHNKTLLFVENFLRTKRFLHIRFTGAPLPAAGQVRVTRLWGAEDDVHPSGNLLTLPVSPDGIDIWEIETAR